MVRLLIASTLVFAVFLGNQATAQQTVRIRGTVERVDGQTLIVKTREGPTVEIRLAENYAVVGLVAAKPADIKPGSYVGAATLPQPSGDLRALEVLIFPEAMRGTGEGHYPHDLVPQSMMTNATVAESATRVDGHLLVVKYKDGEKTIVVPTDAPIVTFVPAEKTELKAGAKIYIHAAQRQADGSIHAGRITVGLGGLTPPM